MGVDLHLTNEQAEWLQRRLKAILDDGHWNCRLAPDHKEHCETILNKINKELKKDSWD